MFFTEEDPRQRVYNVARAQGLPDYSARLLVGQFTHESGGFTNNLYLTSNNPGGMKIPTKRKSKYILGPATEARPPGNEGKTPYAKFASLEDATLDLIDWYKHAKIDLANMTSVEQFSEELRKRAYMGDTEEAKRIYTTSINRLLKSPEFKNLKYDPPAPALNLSNPVNHKTGDMGTYFPKITPPPPSNLFEERERVKQSKKSTTPLELGGEIDFDGEDPENPHTKRLSAAQIKEKYSKNKYVTNGRESWGESLDKNFPITKSVKVRDAILNASKTAKVDPSLLYSSAMEEGLGYALTKPEEVSEAYINATEGNFKSKKAPTVDGKKFVIDGFYNYGLDRFGEAGVAENLIKKGYLPKDFKKYFTSYDATNEKKERIKTAAFTSDEAALTAKAAMLHDTQDQLSTYTKAKGYNLTPEQIDFFTLAGYNGGVGNMQKMLESYNKKGYLKDNKFLDSNFTPASFKDIYTNTQRRVQNRNVLKAEGFFDIGGQIKPKLFDGASIIGDPPTEEEKANLIGGASNTLSTGGIGGVNSIWGIQTTSAEGTPVRPTYANIEGLQRSVNIHPKDTTYKGAAPVPMIPFYTEEKDGFGNIKMINTGKYVNELGKTVDPKEHTKRANEVSELNRLNFLQKERNRESIEKAAAFGATGLLNILDRNETKKRNRVNNKLAVMQEVFTPTFNPYAEGAGSQAIMSKGGSIGGQGLNILDGGRIDAISQDERSPMFEFKGRSHEEGGIGIEYGGKVAEVEDDEVGMIDQEGVLKIFGKMKIPGTSKTFKKAAKEAAKEEMSISRKKMYYESILKNTEENNQYQNSAKSTARVMLKSLQQQSKKVDENKEKLANYQTLMLALSGKNENIMAYGGEIPKRPSFSVGASVSSYDDTPIDPKDVKGVQAIIDKMSGGKSPLKAEDFIEVASKYQIPLELMLAQGIQESHLGTRGKRPTRTKNIFNIGNTDTPKKDRYMGSWKEGLEAYAKLMVDHYGTNVQELLTSNFQRPKQPGMFYANPNYNKQIFAVLKQIDPTNTFTLPEGVGTPAAPTKTQEVREIPVGNAASNNGAAQVRSSVPAISRPFLGGNDDKADAAGAAGKVGGYLYNGMVVKNKPASFSDKEPLLSKGVKTRDWHSPLSVEQIAPELLTLITNKREGVPQLSFQPELPQTFNTSFQAGRNENQASFNQVAKMMEQTGNMSALSQLASNLYKSNENYNVSEIQGNADKKAAMYLQAISTLNDAKVKNLGAIDGQLTRQSAADFNTRKQFHGAFSSIANKNLQNKLENKTYNAYANLFKHYGFDKKGNVIFDVDEAKGDRFMNPTEVAEFAHLKSIGADLSTSSSTKSNSKGDKTETVSSLSGLQQIKEVMNMPGLTDAQKQNLLNSLNLSHLLVKKP